jgi:hypothetical protein
MRRPPEVGQAGLLLILLLSVSGCAGVSTRTTGSSPWPAGSQGANASPPGLFSWWHRTGTETGAAPSAATEVAETAGESPRNSGATQAASSPWPETQSEWVARNFPRFNRLWNGTPAGSPARATDGNDVMWSNRMPDQTPAADTAVTASAPRSDGAVRPTEGGSPVQTDARTGGSGSRAQILDDLPFSPTPPPVKSPRQSADEPASEPGTEPSSAGSAGLIPADSAQTDGARPASFEPEDDPAPAKQKAPEAAGSGSTADQTASKPAALPEILPAPALAGPQDSAIAGRNGLQTRDASNSSTGGAGTTSDAEPGPGLDSRIAQVPPAPPPVQRTPPAPAPSAGAQPASSPPAPPAAPAAAAPGAVQETPASPAPPSPTVAAPAPAPATTTPGAAPATGSGQRPFAASGQSFYASPPPMASPQPRHHLLSWLIHDDTTAPFASSQLPVAAFPTSYSSPQNVLATGQRNAAACETGEKAPKKPCFLKVWIHDWKNSHGSDASDCGHGGACASAQGNGTACESGAKCPKKPCFLKVWIHDWKNSHGSDARSCGHGGACASAQGGNAAACETVAKAPKKPCFLKVWIHDWKNGHGSGCGGCSNSGGSCCQSCKCCGGGKPVTGSAQGGIASAQGGATAQTGGRP